MGSSYILSSELPPRNTVPLELMNQNTVIYSNTNPSVLIHVPTGDYIHAVNCPYAPKTKRLSLFLIIFGIFKNSF